MDSSGGIERVVANKANWLVAHGHEILIITTEQKSGDFFYKLDSRIRHIDLGINYNDINSLPRVQRIIQRYKRERIHKQRLTQTLREFQPDITISTGAYEVFMLPQIKDGGKKILEYHTSKYAEVLRWGNTPGRTIQKLVGYWFAQKLDWITPKYEKVVLLTTEAQQIWNGKNTMVIPNSISFHSDEKSQSNAKKVLAIGRNCVEKNLAALIRIWQTISDKYTDWQLEIVGDGVTGLAPLVSSKSIVLSESTPHIIEKYKQASIYTLTSHYEGLPLVLIEAQHMGLPCIAYDCPTGPKDVITNGVDGFLIPPGDELLFAQKLSELIENEDLRIKMRHHALENSSRFSEDTIMQQWVKLFTQAVANKSTLQ